VPAVHRVIVGTCGSPGSLVALRFADFLARAHDADLVPVLAWEPPGGDRPPHLQVAGDLLRDTREMACLRLRDALAAVWGEVPADPRVQPHVERGPTGWVLVSIANQRGDVLVVGAGRRAVPLLRGIRCQVGRYCAARAACPVILVPPSDLAREAGHRKRLREFRRRAVTPAQLLSE
jgi:nucleotide-binding universal stress UspA family protein